MVVSDASVEAMAGVVPVSSPRVVAGNGCALVAHMQSQSAEPLAAAMNELSRHKAYVRDRNEPAHKRRGIAEAIKDHGGGGDGN